MGRVGKGKLADEGKSAGGGSIYGRWGGVVSAGAARGVVCLKLASGVHVRAGKEASKSQRKLV